MKSIWKEIGMALVMGVVIPLILLWAAVSLSGEETPQTEPTEEVNETQPVSDRKIMVQTGDGTVEQMLLEEYLVGVVLAEMPVSFESEAHKAQAVVARTYTIRADEGKSKHNDAAVCTDSGCCQGYLAPADYLAAGGTQEGIDKIRSAVMETAGYVLTYEGELIEATYFSCSGGSTEDAVAVWGTDVPYLRATDSPGEEEATYYTHTVSFSKENFAKALALELSGNPEDWLGPVTYTAGGGVNTMIIGGISFEGTALRSILGLRSTAFTMTADNDRIIITTRGYGHRVGMSQYGADAMAASGSSYEDILRHYYRGTDLEKWAN